VPFLRRLRELELKVARSNLPTSVKGLRTNALKEWREAREAAIFCVGIGERIAQKVYFAKSEASDYDFVAAYGPGKTGFLVKVQLKEVVPTDVNPAASIQSAIDALQSKYVDLSDLLVAILLNQETHFDPAALQIPELGLAGLWIFGGISSDDWCLWGDFLIQERIGVRFSYPKPTA